MQIATHWCEWADPRPLFWTAGYGPHLPILNAGQRLSSACTFIRHLRRELHQLAPVNTHPKFQLGYSFNFSDLDRTPHGLRDCQRIQCHPVARGSRISFPASLALRTARTRTTSVTAPDIDSVHREAE